MVESDGRIRQQIVNDLEKLIGVTPSITSSNTFIAYVQSWIAQSWIYNP